MLTRLKKVMNSTRGTRGNEGACPLVRSRTACFICRKYPYLKRKTKKSVIVRTRIDRIPGLPGFTGKNSARKTIFDLIQENT